MLIQRSPSRVLAGFTLLAWSAFALASFPSVNSADAQDPDSFLDVVTYNIRYANRGDGEDFWDNRAQTVSRFLAEFDVAGLQEVTAGQLDFLGSELSEHGWYGLGRDDGKRGGEHAPIFYRKDRFDVVDKGTFWLSSTPETVGKAGWDAALPRTCTWMLLKDKQTGQTWWFANTHFDHRGVRAREESAKLVRRVALQQERDVPVVIMGDFNCTPGSDPYRALTSGSKLADAREVSVVDATGPNSTWNGFSEIVPGRVIDHIFVSGPVVVHKLNILDPKTESGRFGSDHLPVHARVQAKTLDATER